MSKDLTQVVLPVSFLGSLVIMLQPNTWKVLDVSGITV